MINHNVARVSPIDNGFKKGSLRVTLFRLLRWLSICGAILAATGTHVSTCWAWQGSTPIPEVSPATPVFAPAVVQHTEFVFDTAPFASCHASTLELNTDGELVCAWFAGEREGDPSVGIWLSRQRGGQWSPPLEVAQGWRTIDGNATPQKFPCWNPVLFQPRQATADGTRSPLFLFFKVGPSPREWWGEYLTSSDGGTTWSEPVKLPAGILGPIKNKPVELNNGRWLCPCSTEDRGWQVHFEYSDDQGKTWHRSADVADPDQLSGIQPTVLETDVGLVALGRSQAGWVFATESADGGASWSPLKPLKVPNPNSGIDAVTMIDGRHALILNPVGNRPNQNNGRRTPLELALSSDTQTWQTVAVLETKPGEYSYPAIIQAGDGRLHVSYTWQRKKIKHVIIQPPALAN